jgi:hypothetical protein
MKKQIIILMFLVVLIYLVLPTNVSAIAVYCGDTICNDFEDYTESNPLSLYYCPSDCGILVNSSWCEGTYSLIPEDDCPTCPTCGGSACDISRISNEDLTNWCSSSNNYVSSNSGQQETETNKYIYWIIFLIIGFVIGGGIKKYFNKK